MNPYTSASKNTLYFSLFPPFPSCSSGLQFLRIPLLFSHNSRKNIRKELRHANAQTEQAVIKQYDQLLVIWNFFLYQTIGRFPG